MRIYKNPLDKRGFYPIIRQTDRQTDRQDKSVLFCCAEFNNAEIGRAASTVQPWVRRAFLRSRRIGKGAAACTALKRAWRS